MNTNAYFYMRSHYLLAWILSKSTRTEFDLSNSFRIRYATKCTTYQIEANIFAIHCYARTQQSLELHINYNLH